VLEGRFVRLELLSPDLREAVREALDCDPQTWEIMSSAAQGEHFDGWWRAAEAEMAAAARIPFAVRRLADSAVVGTTSFMTLRELVSDARNLRSQAAIAKLGAQREGILRRHKITWTGHIRDTAMFSITDLDWPSVRDRLDERLAAYD
jgi:RimJ/RimL family protein N-acetyltransferase